MGALVPKITQKSSFVKPSYTTHIHSPECALCLAVGARRRQEVVLVVAVTLTGALLVAIAAVVALRREGWGHRVKASA